MTEDSTPNATILAMAALVGGLLVLLIGASSSYITNDDYYSGNAASLYSDGRFLAGMVYDIFHGVFSADVGLRYLVDFIMGVVGFFTFLTVAKLAITDQSRAIMFAVFSLAIFGAAEFLFFYDIAPLFYIITFPFISWWSLALKSYVDNPTRRSLMIYGLVSTLVMVAILAAFQVIFYLVFLLLAALLLSSSDERQGRIFRACVVSVAAFVVAFVLVQLFTRSGLYVRLFGFSLRARTAGEMIGNGTLRGLISAFIAAAAKLPTYSGNTYGLHGFLLLFIIARSLSKSATANFWFAAKFLLLLVAIFLSPFLLFKDTVDSARVQTTIYGYGSIALFFASLAVVDDRDDQRLLSPLASVVVAVVALCVLALAIPTRELRYEVYVGVVLLVAVSAAMAFYSKVSATTLLASAILVFSAVEMRRAQTTTERYQTFSALDQIIVSKMDEVIADNLYKFRPKHIEIEYGIRRGILPKTSARSYSYSAAEFWRGRFWSPYIISFKQNNELCKADGDNYEVFKLIESSPGVIKFCV